MICETIIKRIIPAVSADGPWIPYTAAEVIARRAAQTVVIMTCVSATPWSAQAPEMPVALPPIYAPVELVPAVALSPLDPVQVSAPGSLGVLGVGLVLLWWVRR
jgi:hypothetical protein